jgi:hypothetical protein
MTNQTKPLIVETPSDREILVTRIFNARRSHSVGLPHQTGARAPLAARPPRLEHAAVRDRSRVRARACARYGV